MSQETSENSLAIEFKTPSQLRPYPGNARTHSREQIRQIARSIRTFGFTTPIPRHRRHPRLRLAGGMVPAAQDARATSITLQSRRLVEPVSATRVSCFRETEFRGQRQRVVSGLPQRKRRMQRQRRHEQARQPRGFRPRSGNLGNLQNAWWARLDSNQEPDRYERRACPGRSRKFKQLRRRSTTFVFPRHGDFPTETLPLLSVGRRAGGLMRFPIVPCSARSTAWKIREKRAVILSAGGSHAVSN